MRKWLAGLVTVLMLIPQSNVFAATTKNIHVSFNKISIKVNGQPAASNNILYDGTTYVPLRNIAEMMDNLPVTFYPNENIVNIGAVPSGKKEPGIPATQSDGTKDDAREESRDATIDAVFDAITIMVNLEKVESSNLLYNGRTYVPLRAVSNILGLDVTYDEPTSTAYIGKIPDGEIATSDSSNKPAASGMYSVPAEGDMAGWMLLKGHPYEGNYEIYYTTDGKSLSVTSKDIRNLDMNEKFSWVDEFGQTRVSTRQQLYTLMGTLRKVADDDWLLSRFGDLYMEYVDSYVIHPENLVTQYLKETGQMKPIDSNVILKPGVDLKTKEVTPTAGYNKYADGTVVFYAYDKYGNYRGEFIDRDDRNYVEYLRNNRTEPPKLSDKWMSLNVLQKIYEAEVSVDSQTLILKNAKEEIMHLSLPADWNRADVKETKINNIRIKKYSPEQNATSEKWIDLGALKEKAGITMSITDSVDDLALYGPYDEKLGKSPKLFDMKFPKSWSTSTKEDAINVNGLRVKKENDTYYFFVEDLVRLKILTDSSEKREFSIYLNVDDLVSAGLLK
ncbi:copper amine oxidase N-terminal domain-containing protein [Paenibacillus hamazuiensis]|uniref:copper amine oxidase N-terminal domain-containing protein n=1 Tax=Paenibacillus hamazuiensis TaxID=2936508 RepID=UPI0020108444|nr:copper amine oxidase N-terminal domain-containing protein [Paenibacillus hamazuiensis]